MFGIGSFEEIYLLFGFPLAICWAVFFKKKNYPAILTISILLVVTCFPHLSILNHFFFGDFGREAPSVLLLILIFGVGFFAVGTFGIIYSAIVMARKSTNINSAS